MDPHLAAEEVVGIEIAQHDIGVSHGRLRAAESVAGRTRRRAGTLGTDLDQSAVIDPGDAAAARTHLGQVDDRNTDRLARALGAGADAAADAEIMRDAWPSVPHYAGL